MSVDPTPLFHILAGYQEEKFSRPLVTTGSPVMHLSTPGYEPHFLGLHMGDDARLTISVGERIARDVLAINRSNRVTELTMLCGRSQISISRTFLTESECGVCLAVQREGSVFGVLVTLRPLVDAARAFAILDSYIQSGATNLNGTHRSILGRSYESLDKKGHSTHKFIRPNKGVIDNVAIQTVPILVLDSEPVAARPTPRAPIGVQVLRGKWGEEIDRDILRAVVPVGTSWRMPDPQNTIDEHYFIEDK